MKLYRLTVTTQTGQSLVVFDSSEARMMRDLDHAMRSRWTASAELAVLNDRSERISKNQLLDALNGRTDNWPFVAIETYENGERMAA